MSSTRDEIYLAALLHDIGKFYQRADKGYYSSDNLSEQSRRIAQQICPVTRAGYFSHQHVIWTNEFFENYQSLFQKFTKSNTGPDNIANLASYHHRPATLFQAMIQLADWWASGLDRSQTGAYETFDIGTGRQRYKEVPLSNILGAIRVKENESDREGKTAEKPYSFRLNPLSFDRDTVMPENVSLNSEEDYRKLWNQFETRLKTTDFNTTSLRDFNITMFHLLKLYTWYIPSFTQDDFPFISLFEHLKITSAIAQCFYDYFLEEPGRFIFDEKKKRLRLTEDAYPLQLVCFDLSGIQAFLYNVSSTHALKSLRGRSFYLQMLIESLVWYLIRGIPEGFTPSHIVYSSGGKFFMLLPNTRKVNSLINNLSVKLQQELWKKHRGDLYLNLGKKAFRYENDIRPGKPNIKMEGCEKEVFLGSIWESVFDEVNLVSGRKYAELLASGGMFGELFEPSGAGGNERLCAVTGVEYPVHELYAVEESDEWSRWVRADQAGDLTDRILISAPVKEQIELGRKLVNHKFITFGPAGDQMKGEFYGLPGFNYNIASGSNEANSDSLIIQNLNEAAEFPAMVKGREQAYAFRYFGGATVAMKDGEPLTFSDIARNDNKSSFTRLGVLRMDVDNLGKLFTTGFREWDEDSQTEVARNASFSAYACFSGLLDLFFSGYINTIRESEKYKNTVNIIYSGGDDLFAVGRWDSIIEFAGDVKEEFRNFTGRNDISLSAGIELVTPKFPISKAAENAGRAEARAKMHTDLNNKTKNSLCILDTPVNWDSEWPMVVDIRDKIKSWLEKKFISRGMIMFILSLYSRWKHIADFENREDYSWKWIAAYNIARRLKDVQSSPEAKNALEELQEILFTRIGSNRIRFDVLALACRLVEFETRTNK